MMEIIVATHSDNLVLIRSHTYLL